MVIIRLLFLLFPICVFAQELKTEVVPQSGTTSDEFTFTVTIEGSADTTRPQLSTGSDFEASYLGPQSSVTIVNGSMNSEIHHLYRLYPKRTGKLLTPSVDVSVGGRQLSAAPLTVTVSKPSPQSAAAGSEYFLEQLVDSNTVYAGQQIVNTLRLYSKVRVLEANFSDLSFDRVWVEEIGKQESYRKILGGHTYTVHELKRAIFPLVQSDLTLPEREILIKVVDKGKKQGGPLSRFGFFSDNVFGFAQTTIKRLRSKPLDISVLPLPQVPQALSDAHAGSIPVGETEISTGLNTESIEVGGSKTLSIVVQSSGNLHPLEDIQLPTIEGVKIYPEHPETSYSLRNSKLLTKKTFKYSFVPLRGGIINIPSIKLLYFNPKTSTYKIASTRDTKFFVKGESASQKDLTKAQQEPAEQLSPITQAEKSASIPELTKYSKQASILEKIHPFTLVIIVILVVAFTLLIIALARHFNSKSLRKKLLTEINSAEDSVLAREKLCALLNYIYSPQPPIHTGDIKERLPNMLTDEGLTFKLLSLTDELELHAYSNKDDMRPLSIIVQDLARSLSGLI